MMFEVPVAAQRLGVALAIGLLIGLERGWHERELAEGERIAGIRTFGLIGLLGGVTATLEEDFGGWIAAEMAVRNTAAFAKLVLAAPLGIKVGGRDERVQVVGHDRQTAEGIKGAKHARQYGNIRFGASPNLIEGLGQ